jgi:hypothetical protein
MRRAIWRGCGLLYVALFLLWLGPGSAKAELPRVSLPAAGQRHWHLDLLAGTHEVGASTYVPRHDTSGGRVKQPGLLDVEHGRNGTGLASSRG